MAIAGPEKSEGVPRTPVVFLLDTSGSMAGQKIKRLNEGLQVFKRKIADKYCLSRAVDISVIIFGGKVEVIQEFIPVSHWTPPTLTAEGHTPMGSAIEQAIDLIEKRQSYYQSHNIPYTKFRIFLLTDGKPTDMSEGDRKWMKVKNLLEEGEKADLFNFFAGGTDSADIKRLNNLVDYSTKKNVFKIDETEFVEYFEVISNSVEQASDSSYTLSEGGSDKVYSRFIREPSDEIGDRLESIPLSLNQLPKKDPEAYFYYFTDSTYTTKESRFRKLDDRLTLLARHRVGLDVIVIDRDRGVSPYEWEILINGLNIENYPALVVANDELGVLNVDPATDSFSPSDIEYAVLENGIIADQILKDIDEINDFLNVLFDCARNNNIKSGMRREKIIQGLKIGKGEISTIINVPVN